MIERHPGYDEAVLAALAAWDGPGGCGWQTHPGDLGWFARVGPARVEADAAWWSVGGGEVAAVAFLDGTLRTAVAPSRLLDVELADAMTAYAVDRAVAAVDPPPGACALRPALAAAGYEAGGEPWLHLYRPTGAVCEVGFEVRTVTSSDVAADRVAVQRAAFERSSYTLELLADLRRSPAYDAARDLVLYVDGRPGAVGTAWTAGPGRCGLIEPLGVDAAYRGRGLGRAAVAAACEALAAAGASGTAVWTPAANWAAAALYRSCGFRAVVVHHALVRG